MKRVILLALAAANLTACGQPEPRPKKETAAAPAVKPDTPGPTPSAPIWAGPYMGKILTELPQSVACIGNTDGVPNRYAGPPAGAAIGGWGWDTGALRRIERVLITDESRKVIGAGDGGFQRLDVPRAQPQIKDERTGWRGYAPAVRGLVMAYGFVDGGAALCPLGEIEL